MSERVAQDDVYRSAEELLVAGHPIRAEAVLRAAVDEAPRAAQMLYLLGITLFLQGRIPESRKVIERAFAVKPWVREPGLDVGLEEALVGFGEVDPDWQWPAYELLLRRWSSVGFRFERVVASLLIDENSVIVQVGANDGRRSDPIFPILERRSFRALLLEPLPQPFAALERLYRDRPQVTPVNCAIADYDGTLELFTVPDDRTTLASARPERNALRNAVPELESHEVECLTFETLLARHGIERVDLLQIDTEGMDAVVFESFDLESFMPRVVHLEFYCLTLDERVAMMRRLERHGYVWRFDGRDLLAARGEALPEEFCAERNGRLVGGLRLP